MASEHGLASPESSVTSLLATSGRLQSSFHPEPVSTIRYKDKHYVSASEALDAYICDFQRSLRDSETSTGKLELPKQLSKPQPRNRDVLKTSLTDGELNFLNIPVQKSASDRLSVTTDDLLALPNDGSLPVTRTSALLSRSGSFSLGLSFNSSSRSHSRAAVTQKRSTQRPAPPACRKSLPVDDLLMGGFLRSHHQAPPLANRTRPPDALRSSHLPRWMTSQKSEMDFSGMTSVPDLKYPLWLRQCEVSSDGQQSDRPLRVPSWVADLEESSGDTKGDQIGCLILRAEQMFNAPSLDLCEPLKEHNSSGDTEDALDADRSWDNPPVAFKSPVPVGGADEPQPPEDLQRSKSAASCSSGYSSRKHPGPVEALKHMLFRLQAVEHKISQSHGSSEVQTTARLERETLERVPQEETEETEMGSGESLQRALLHLDRLKTLVDDMNERKARAEDDAIIWLHESVQSTGRRSERSIERTFISLLTVPNGMAWGSWGQREFCPSGTYAKGFSLKVEEPVFWDNTALNGIRLHCVSQTSEDVSVQSDVGSWGKWTKIKWCPSGFLTAFQLRVQSSQGLSDETAANNIRFNCSQGFYLQGDGTDLGEWGNWSPQCQGRGMCGIRTRIEEPQGLRKDDTALNDVRMFCCE